MDIDSKFNNHMHYKTHLFCNDDKFIYLDRTAQLLTIHYGSYIMVLKLHLCTDCLIHIHFTVWKFTHTF